MRKDDEGLAGCCRLSDENIDPPEQQDEPVVIKETVVGVRGA